MAVTERGCGLRQSGGIYIALHLVAGGAPADSFLIDPPQILDVDALGLSPRGVTILPVMTAKGVKTHYVYDIVGREHYPNVADFIEEVRRQGLSRRVARNIDFSLLDANSRIIMIHERAWINEHERYQREGRNDGRSRWCPRDIPQHMRDDYDGMCAALWWHDIDEGLDPNDPETPGGKLTYGSQISTDQPGVQMHIRRADPAAVVRQMPSFAYRGHRRPIGVNPTYQTAAFMSFPIRTIEVVRDLAGGTHTDAITRAKRAQGIEVCEVDE